MQEGPENIVDVDVSLLLEIDPNVLTPVQVEQAKLTLEDLEKIDWDLVASSVLGVMDPIGQLRDWLAGVLSNFIDMIKKAFEALVKPVSDAVSTLLSWAKGIGDALVKLTDMLRGVVVDPILKALDWVSKTFPAIADAVSRFVSQVFDALARLPDAVRDFVTNVAELFSGLAEKIKDGLAWLLEQLGKLPDIVRDLISKVSDLFSDLATKVREGFSWFAEQVTKLPDLIKGLVDRVAGLFADLADKVKSGFSWFIEQVAKLPDVVKDLASRITGAIGDLAERVKAGFAWLLEQLGKVPDMVKSMAARVADAFADLAGRVREGFAALLELLARTPEAVKNIVEKIVGDVSRGIGGVVEWVRRGYEAISTTINEWFKGAREWFEAATTLLRQVGAGLMGFVNAVMQLPERLSTFFKPVLDFFMNLGASLGEFLKDPLGWLRKHLVEPLWNALVIIGGSILEGLKKLGELAWQGLSWLWEKIVGFFTWVRDRAVDLGRAALEMVFKVSETVAGWLWGLVSPWFKSSSPLIYVAVVRQAPDVEKVIQHTLKTTAGVGETLWNLYGMLLPLYWQMTLVPMALRGFIKMFGDVDVVIEPAVVGTKAGGAKWSIKLSELADAVTRGFEMFSTGYAMGASMAIASMFTVNLQHLYVPRVVAYYDSRVRELLGDILKEELEKGAEVNMFIRPVSETTLIDYARRMLALSEGVKDKKTLEKYLATVRAHLKIYGLPKWYIDFLTSDPEQLAVKFIDRFGAERKIYLSHVFELPTHSEMARMTQRDIFPGVDVMKKVAWVRGWNEDLTTMMYLLTFKYPSFEKLWSFYMRALSGMLWFKAPDTIAAVFASEAKEVGAGVPVSPLDLQKALAGPDQVRAFETALNAYFKWLEYSNFSWFTDKTEMYGIPVGREVISKLGGWTADSWLLVDVATDIPGKIDMRWMSRFGIFQLMSERFAQLGVSFESYAPLVEVVPKLMDANPASAVQVDLTWFSKLLQATGLHPAWVPITTVAENIMAISDEMTLLRTGWLNLFKEGLITVDVAEKSLAGLIVASYRVGYWDPEKKTWTSGWINLPVRWLPHERRLLELRMLMDRIMDLYREYYGYLRSGVRTLAITEEEALERLKAFVEKLNEHYKKISKQITGVETSLQFDVEYLELWTRMIAELRDIEAVERARAWWSRVSGWLLYRIAYGYVRPEDIDRLIEEVSKVIPLHSVEVNAYKTIVKAVLGLVGRELVPAPSTLATLAEYVSISPELVKKSLDTHRVPEEWRPVWEKYISVRPFADDARVAITAYFRALRYSKYFTAVFGKQPEFEIPGDIAKSAEDLMKFIGMTDQEKAARELAATIDALIDLMRERARELRTELREWRPSLLTLITISEYVPEAARLIEKYVIDPEFKPIVLKYAAVKPLADDVRTLVSAYYRAVRYAALYKQEIPKEVRDQVEKVFKDFGITDTEKSIRDLAVYLQILVDEWRDAAKEYIPTPSTLASMAEYIPEVRKYAAEALAARSVRGVWYELWMKYIYVRPVIDEVRRWANAVFDLAEYAIISVKQLEPIFKILATYGWEELEIEIAERTVLAVVARRAFTWLVGTPHNLATMSRYTDKAADMAWTRISTLVDLLPVDDATKQLIKQMWKEYVTVYQASPEISGYITELIAAYGEGVLDDAGLEQELQALRRLGVPELRLQLAKRRAYLRRVRRLARSR